MLQGLPWQNMILSCDEQQLHSAMETVSLEFHQIAKAFWTSPKLRHLENWSPVGKIWVIWRKIHDPTLIPMAKRPVLLHSGSMPGIISTPRVSASGWQNVVQAAHFVGRRWIPSQQNRASLKGKHGRYPAVLPLRLSNLWWYWHRRGLAGRGQTTVLGERVGGHFACEFTPEIEPLDVPVVPA